MPNKAGPVLLAVGAALLTAALSLFFYNRWEDAQAGRTAGQLLAGVRSAAGQQEQAAESEAAAQSLPGELPVVEWQDYDCVGTLSIPALELELPVLAQWDYTRLKTAPCRQFGSSRTDDLVIAAHNYQAHFGRLNQLAAGDTVLFTDMDGVVNTYTVARVEVLAPDAVDAVQNSGCALVLYTCTKGGASRVAVFCQRAEIAPPPAG